MTTSRSFLILHGWQNHRPEGHWQHWLADELTARGHRVAYPQLPDPDRPDLETWLGRLRTQLAEGPDTVVCHSLAVVLWLHAVARGDAAADRVLLVAPPSSEVLAGYEEVAGFGGPTATAAQVAAASGATRLVAGDDDPYCAGGAADHYGKLLGLETDVVAGGGHLSLDEGYGAWPSVLDWCLDPSVRLAARPAGAAGTMYV
ncbi:RBBP9/YdeN family alpha/beta hydrolase [Streptomyces sp. NBC_01465]|uniref:RBBP9/YdeN family alpha/beta hydrolase n=1 Tax=Streptomyces sp. NBC_01465 TaxID=2903878 RepID=UPI002E30E89D|nr:alpha/beta hydrolase [Streptomyces sp. NBC_01465]